MGYGEYIKNLLDEKGMSVAELSRLTGIPSSSLYATIRRNSEKMDMSYLEKISKVMNVSIDRLSGALDWNDEIGDIDYNLSASDQEALEHFRPLNDKNKDKARDYMDLLKLQQDQLQDPGKEEQITG